jgi:hypothetical protein
MIPVGVGVVFLAYTTGIWGYCLIRGYNVKFTQLFGTAWPGAGKAQASGLVIPPSLTGPGAGQIGQVPTPSTQPSIPSQLTGQ